jgi:pyruvate kinase
LSPPSAADTRTALDALSAEVDALRADCVAGEAAYATELAQAHPTCRDSARNLVHYLVLRRADRRALQAELQAFGLSSLGSLEAHVLPTLDAVAAALAALRGASHAPPRRASFGRGSALLQQNADAALGPSPDAHRTRVIVTAPPEAATDPAVLVALHAAQMNILRINTAHDGADAWCSMVQHLRAAECAAGTTGTTLIQFDLAGPKLRTGTIAPAPPRARWEVHEAASVVLHAEGAPPPGDAPGVGLHVPLAAGAGGPL